MDMADTNIIEEAVEFWQSRTSRKLSLVDGREIVCNVTGFFAVLDEWDRKLSSSCNASSHSLLEEEGAK